MKESISILLFLSILLSSWAQEMKIIEDESCGCDIVLINGIETTKDGDLYGFRLENGTQIAPNIYRYVDRFHGGYCKVMLDIHQCGLIDSTGRQVVPCIYDDVSYPSDGRVLVAKDGLLGVFSGGLTACSAGIAAAIFFGLLTALLRKSFSR